MSILEETNGVDAVPESQEEQWEEHMRVLVEIHGVVVAANRAWQVDGCKEGTPTHLAYSRAFLWEAWYTAYMYRDLYQTFVTSIPDEYWAVEYDACEASDWTGGTRHATKGKPN